MSKNKDEDMDYFSEDENNDSLSEDSKSEASKEEEEQINQTVSPDSDDEEEDNGENLIKRIKKVDNYEEDYEDENEIFQEDDDKDYDDYEDEDDDDEADEKQMNSSIRHGGASSNSHNLESSLQRNQDNDSSDDETEINDNYLQKFEQEINKNYIVDFHPECFVHNYEEISSLAQIIRDVNNNIIDPLHKTIPFLTKYEKARVLGIRAKQINTGSKPFVSVPENIMDGFLIAEMELKEKRLPFIIKRPLPGGTCEYWKMQDLEIIGF